MLGYIFGASLLLSLAFVGFIRQVSLRFKRVVQPRQDRWHKRPTPTLGGVGIFLAFSLALLLDYLIRQPREGFHWGLLVGSGTIFLLGLYDDLKTISPPAKLIGQILAAALVVFLGYKTNFFTPKIASPILAQVPNILLTFIWLVGLTNAINLLDNMDGLAAGISLIATGFLGYFFYSSRDYALLTVSLALAGSLTGFLFFNFPPASIFMGDSGSLFLGFTLALLAIARQPQASNVFAVMGVPTLLFLLPILDTFLVTITRILRGQSPAKGGRDHTSHRLIAFGLTEIQALMFLYGIAMISGLAAVGIETLDYWLSLVLVPLLVVTLALLVAYLGRIQVVSTASHPPAGTLMRLIGELTYRRRILEIILDFFLISLAYYLAFWFNFDLAGDIAHLELFLSTLPLALLTSFVSFFVLGVYRGVWRYVGVDDLLRYGKAVVGGVGLLAMAVLILFPQPNLTADTVVTFGIILFIALAASRSSFKILDSISSHRTKRDEERVLVLGAGDAGEMAARWMLMNPQLGFRPVGYLDDDPYNLGRQIHGIPIIGRLDQLEQVLEKEQIDGVIITSDSRISAQVIEKVMSVCHLHRRWVRNMRLEFELLE